MKIYNVKIFTMNKALSIIEKGWVEITEGKITAVCEGTPSSFEDVDIDGGGAALPASSTRTRTSD